MLGWDRHRQLTGPARPQPATSVQRVAGLVGALVTSLITVLLAAAPAAAQPASPIAVFINDVRVDTTKEALKLDAETVQRFKVVVTNNTPSEINVSIVSFEGQVIGLPVFRCEGLIALSVPSGATGERQFEMDPNCLKDQATGLIPARVSAYDDSRALLARWAFTIDLKGSLKSIYGLFGIALVAITVFSILGALISLARHRLSPNRWSRAMRFAIPGIGLGFTIVFGLAAAGVAVPDSTRWIPIVGASFVILGLLGYFSPRPDEPEMVEFVPASAADTVLMPGGAAITAPMEPVPEATAPPEASPPPAGYATDAPTVPPLPGGESAAGLAGAETQPHPAPGQGPASPTRPSSPAAPPPSQTVRRIAPEEQGEQ